MTHGCGMERILRTGPSRRHAGGPADFHTIRPSESTHFAASATTSAGETTTRSSG
jgi:hypothetical protein